MSGSAVREMTLTEEILALKKYNVPDNVIERIFRKVDEMEEWENNRAKNRIKVVKELQDRNRHKDYVIDALGEYLEIKKGM